MRLKHNAISITLALALSLAAATTVNAQFRIGHIATMSGPLGGVGIDQYDGFMLRVEQNGGLLGDQKVKVVRVDDQGKPDVGLQVTKELIEKEKVDMVVGVTVGNVLLAVYPYIVGAQVPFLATNGGTSALAGVSCSPWYVSTAFQTDGVHEAAAQEAKARGYKNVVVIVPNYQGGKDAVAGFKRFYKEGVAEEIYPAMGQSDFSAELTQVVAAAPDAVYTFLPGAMGINFVKQYAMAGLTKKYPLISSWTVDDLTLPALRDAAVGTIVSAHWTSDADNAPSKKFVKEFEAKYNRKASVYAMQGYDAAVLIEQALKTSPEAAKDKKVLMKALRPENFGSIRGDIRINRNGFPIQDYSMWEVVKKPSGEVGFKLRNVALRAHPDPYVSQCPANQ